MHIREFWLRFKSQLTYKGKIDLLLSYLYSTVLISRLYGMLFQKERTETQSYHLDARLFAHLDRHNNTARSKIKLSSGLKNFLSISASKAEYSVETLQLCKSSGE